MVPLPWAEKPPSLCASENVQDHVAIHILPAQLNALVGSVEVGLTCRGEPVLVYVCSKDITEGTFPEGGSGSKKVNVSISGTL